ncbi:hypothetical protein QBC46DRAFT_462385 [Diplogelasinospora grovesii]|uniref:Clr5 domain-containing protein n=1 Tax=Diplogelasinospora grovesii TaxID=303347 RepID=A0AAN6MX22_9PEZI|nr:hypothetical protein QBC46DRAFT_462385 [Diplogelasinospora grovesii]
MKQSASASQKSTTDSTSPESPDLVQSVANINNSSSVRDGAAAAAPTEGGQEPLMVPGSAADWEAKKDIIEDLYLKKNLILNEVIVVMTNTHRFRATARMYKGQFSKWKWNKYKKSGQASISKRPATPRRKKGLTATQVANPDQAAGRQPSLRSSQRSPQPPRPAILVRPMLYQDEETLQVESTLNAYGMYISSWSERETPWKSELSPGDMLRGQQNSILQNIRVAWDHFKNKEPARGGEVLQLAFDRIGYAVATGRDLEAIWDCCLAVPQLALHMGWYDILVIFTRYVCDMTSLKLSVEHPIAKIARNTYKLAERAEQGRPDQLRLYVNRSWKLWIDLVGRVRGEQDHVTIHLKRGYVILMNPENSIMQSLISDFSQSVKNSLAKRGEQGTTTRILELESLLTRMYIPLFSLESTHRAQRMLRGVLLRIENKPGNQGVPVNKWDYVDRYLFFSAYHFLASIADYNRDFEMAASYRRKSLESPKDRFWLQTALRLEAYLRSEGRNEEADAILSEHQQMPSLNC